jgi:hypothetical protein
MGKVKENAGKSGNGRQMAKVMEHRKIYKANSK